MSSPTVRPESNSSTGTSAGTARGAAELREGVAGPGGWPTIMDAYASTAAAA
jgi:hypothetical protein